MRSASRRLVLACAAAVTAACSHTTGGAAVTPHPNASGRTSAPVAAPPTVAPQSDEDQIKAAVKIFADAYNSENWEAYLDDMCAPMRAGFTSTAMDYLKKGRERSGATTATVTSVSIDGDNATAKMQSRNETLGTMEVSLPLRKEDEGWKICQLKP